MDGAMDQRILFIKTLADIDERLDSADDYDVVRVTALLRQLLLDQHPLVTVVNHSHRLKVRFRIAVTPGLPAELHTATSVYLQLESLDPDMEFPRGKIQEVSREEFLNIIVIIAYGERISIREIIRYTAHVAGGVHSGSPKDDKDRIMNDMAQRFYIGGYQGGLMQLLSISRIVRKALEPLRVIVEAEVKSLE